MYRTVFPHCTVVGSVQPVPYNHFIKGAIPMKCQDCQHLFEGGCTRAMDQVQHYLSLDHGSCPVKGSTKPVLVETKYYKSKVYVPEKCRTCSDLHFDKVHGFVCNLDRTLWGAFPRTLDWGSWSPEHPNLGLQSGRSVSQEVLSAISAQNEVQAIKAFRRSHPDATIKEARDAYVELCAQFDQFGR